MDPVARVGDTVREQLSMENSSVNGDLDIILMETSHRLVTLPEVPRRGLSKAIQMSRWEILALAIEKRN